MFAWQVSWLAGRCFRRLPDAHGRQWRVAVALRIQSRGRLRLRAPAWVARSAFPILPRRFAPRGNHTPPLWRAQAARVKRDCDGQRAVCDRGLRRVWQDVVDNVPPSPISWGVRVDSHEAHRETRGSMESTRGGPLALLQTQAQRLQELRRSDRSGDRGRADRRCRAEWLRQVEPAGGDALGDGREPRQRDARRRHGGRDLRRCRHKARAKLRRGGADHR